MQTNTLPSTVSARQIQRDYKSVFSQVKKTNKPIMVISNNEPQVVLISIEKFNQYFQAETETKFWEAVSEIQSKNRYNDPITTQKDIDEAVETAKQEVYDKYYGSAGHQRANKRPTHSSKPTRENNSTLATKKVRDNYLTTNS